MLASEADAMDLETLLRTFDADAAASVRAAIAEFKEAGGSEAVIVQAAASDFPIGIRYFRSMRTGLATFQLVCADDDDGGDWQIHTHFVPWSGVEGLTYERAERSDHKGTTWRIHADSPAIDATFYSEEEVRRFAAPALGRARDE
jgi:hypothetical protein